MFNLFNNTNIFIWIEKLINFINSIFFVLLLIALSFALIFSPPDYLQGDSVRIMYVHVPAAWIGLASFSCIALLSISNFIFKIKNFTLITKSIAPIGLMFTCLAIVTGSIWGQPTWGTFWAWDARITSMVILALFYVMYIATHKLIVEKEKAEKKELSGAHLARLVILVRRGGIRGSSARINCKLLRLMLRFSSKIINTCLKPLFPRIKVH